MKIIHSQGFDKESAFNKQANYNIIHNATILWQKAGKPLGEELKVFAETYLENKVKSAPGMGCYIVVNSPVKDDRERPYKVENIVSVGKRKWQTFFLPIETETGNPVDFDGELPVTKAEGLQLAKKLTTKLKIDITIEVVKKVVEGEQYAAIVKYTPSIKTKIGSFVFFGYENN